MSVGVIKQKNLLATFSRLVWESPWTMLPCPCPSACKYLLDTGEKWIHPVGMLSLRKSQSHLGWKTSKIMNSNIWPISTLSIGPWHYVISVISWTSRNGDSTISLGSLLKCLTSFSWRNSSWCLTWTSPGTAWDCVVLSLSLVAW